MISVKSAKCSHSDKADYFFEHADDYFDVLPYLYGKIIGKWYIMVLADNIKEIRHIFNVGVPEDVTVDVLTDQSNIEQFLMEHPDTRVAALSPYEMYMELFRDIGDIIFDPKAVSEIYKRAGPNIEELEKALQQVIQTSDGIKVTMQDVDKVLLPNKRVYASDIARAFLHMRECPWRWQLVDRFINDLGQDFAFYSVRKYIQQLLQNKNKYLHNETVAERYARDVQTVDAFTVIHAYATFTKYNKPAMFRAVLRELEGRNFTNVSVHT